MLSKIVKRLVLSFTFLLLGGCVVSYHPLSPESRLPSDSPLIGAWITVENDKPEGKSKTSFVHIGNEGKAVRLEIIGFNGGEISRESYAAIPTKLSGNSYLSIQKGTTGDSIYILCKYQISPDNRLVVWLTNDDFIRDAVKKGLLRGHIESLRPKGIESSDESYEGTVLLTDDQQTLQDFISKNDSSIFNKPTFMLERIEAH